MNELGKACRANVCVVGCGHWGKNLARNFADLGHLAAVCEADPVRLQSFAVQYPDAKPFQSYEALLKDPKLNAVVLATPAEQHYSMAMDALREGKDVFVEKPIALHCNHAEDIIGAAQKYGRILMVGHLLRYHPAILKIQELLAQGVLGTIEYIYSNRLNMGKIRREENALWSFAPHDVSVILALVGGMPIQVTVTGGAYLQPNIADVTVSNLLFDRGTRSHIFVSWLHPYKEQRLVVIGSKQMIAFEDTRAQHKLILFDRHIETKNGFLEASKPNGTPVPFDDKEPLAQECAHFIDCVRHRVRPTTDGEEGLRVLQVLSACQRSLQMNGQPVQMDSLAAHRPLTL